MMHGHTYIKLRLISSFAWDAGGWWRKTLFCRVGDLHARCVSGCRLPQSGVLRVNPSGDQKYGRRRTEEYSRMNIPATWHGIFSTQREARELISAPDLATRARLLSFNRTRSRVVIGLLTGYNTLWRHIYIYIYIYYYSAQYIYLYIYWGWVINPICRICGAGDETSVHILCKALASLRHTYVGSFILDPEDIRKLSIGAIWNFAKGRGLLWFSNRTWGTKGLS